MTPRNSLGRWNLVAIAFSALVIALLFLAPVVPYSIPPGVYHCPPRGCQFLRYGSVTFWALGVGATVREARGYSFSLVTGTTAASSTSTVVYTRMTNSTSGSTGRGFYDDYIVTSDAHEYLPNGYYAERVNLTQLRNGDVVKVGPTSFRFEIPATEMTNGSVTTIVDYICPSFFHALFSNGSEFSLDYCTPTSQANRTSYVTTTITTAGSVGTELSSTYVPWSMWELSRNTVPRVGIHVEGVGNETTVIELIVAK